MWYVYVLLCEDNSLYTGATNNLQNRLEAHKTGKASRYTRAHKVVKLLYSEILGSKSEALKREAKIKSWSRIQKIKQLSLNI